jgi:hypothetical protein
MGRVVHATKIETAMVDLSWLRGHAVTNIAWSNPLPWVFTFDDRTSITVECPWRILRSSEIALSSEDHLQKYGLPAPIDAMAEARDLLSPGFISDVVLTAGTLDLSLTFSTALVLQLIPFFRGYECWQISRPGHLQFIGMPGGGVSTCPE